FLSVVSVVFGSPRVDHHVKVGEGVGGLLGGAYVRRDLRVQAVGEPHEVRCGLKRFMGVLGDVGLAPQFTRHDCGCEGAAGGARGVTPFRETPPCYGQSLVSAWAAFRQVERTRVLWRRWVRSASSSTSRSMRAMLTRSSWRFASRSLRASLR